MVMSPDTQQSKHFLLFKTLYLGHVVVVQGEVGELLIQGELHLVVVVAVLCHGCDSYSVCEEQERRRGVIFTASVILVLLNNAIE